MGVGVGWTQGSMHGVGVGLKVKVWGIFFFFSFYTPGIYADGYIVFAFPFVRSYVS